jgi:hypothetical protein
MLEWIDAGWELGEFSPTGGVFFCTKGVERRQVEISPTDPGIEYDALGSPLESTLHERASLVLRANA